VRGAGCLCVSARKWERGITEDTVHERSNARRPFEGGKWRKKGGRIKADLPRGELGCLVDDIVLKAVVPALPVAAYDGQRKSAQGKTRKCEGSRRGSEPHSTTNAKSPRPDLFGSRTPPHLCPTNAS